MGIRNLKKILERHCPAVVKPVDLSLFHGKRVAIDGNLLTMRFHYGNTDYSLIGLWYRFLRSLQSQSIQPVVLFDGNTRLPQKNKTMQRRKDQRDLLLLRSADEKIHASRLAEAAKDFSTTKDASLLEHESSSGAALDQLQRSLEVSFTPSRSQVALRQRESVILSALEGSGGERSASEREMMDLNGQLDDLAAQSADLAASYEARCQTVTRAAYDEIETLVGAMGLPLIKTTDDSAHEAEALGAVLYNTGDVAAVITEDTDVLLYDALMLRNLVGTTKEASMIHGREVREALGLDRSAFVDLGLLCGSDFVETIPKIGWVSAYKLIKAHNSIENILQADIERPVPRYAIPDIKTYLSDLALAREVFHSPPVLPTEPGALDVKPVDTKTLTELLKKYGLEGLSETPGEDLDFVDALAPNGSSSSSSSESAEEWPEMPDDRF